MTTEEFARNFYIEKERLMADSFSFDRKSPTAVSTKIAALNLDEEQTEKVKDMVSTLLTDAFYTVLLGLDGSTSIGNSNQEVFKVYDEEGHLISDCGDLEVEAYEYFHNNKFEFENTTADFIATLIYNTTEEVGRNTPVRSGFRPQVKLYFDELLTSGQQIFIGRSLVFPGETVQAEIKIVAVEHFANQLKTGMKFEFSEGETVIGTGEITHLKNEALQANR